MATANYVPTLMSFCTSTLVNCLSNNSRVGRCLKDQFERKSFPPELTSALIRSCRSSGTLNTITLNNLSPAMKNLTDLDLANNQDFHQPLNLSFLASLTLVSPNLETLNLSNQKFNLITLKRILLNCPRLSQLVLRSTTLTMDMISAISSHRGLREIDLSSFTLIQDVDEDETDSSSDDEERGIKRAFEAGDDEYELASPSKKRCNSHTQVKKNEEAMEIDESPMTLMMTRPSESTSLNNTYESIKLNLSASDIPSKMLPMFAMSFCRIESLDLSKAKNCVNLNPFLRYCSSLKSLTIDECDICEVVEKFPPLTFFSHCGTGQISETFMISFSSCFSSLQVLKMRNKSFEDEKHISYLINCKDLRVLDLYDVFIPSDCLDRIIKSGLNSKLEEVDITYSLYDSFDRFVSVPWPSLKKFTSNQTSYKNLERFSKHAPNLESLCLHLNLSKSIKGRQLKKILSLFPAVQKFTCFNLESLSDEELLQIKSSISNIRELVLSTMKETPSSEALQQLCNEAPQLSARIWCNSTTKRQFITTGPIPENDPISKLGIQLEVQDHMDGDISIDPQILVDGVPLWVGEAPVSFHYLNQTVGNSTSIYGALPICTDYCCDWDVKGYNGVQFYESVVENEMGQNQVIVWDIHEPGPSRKIIFEKSQYISALNNARIARINLLWHKSLSNNNTPTTITTNTTPTHTH